MPDWAWIVAFVVVYVILMQWLLPKLGVPTWRSQDCAGSQRKTSHVERAVTCRKR